MRLTDFMRELAVIQVWCLVPLQPAEPLLQQVPSYEDHDMYGLQTGTERYEHALPALPVSCTVRVRSRQGRHHPRLAAGISALTRPSSARISQDLGQSHASAAHTCMTNWVVSM